MSNFALPPEGKPKILFFDIENVQLPQYLFHPGRYKGMGGRVAPGFLADMAYVLCLGYKWLGGDSGVIATSEAEFTSDPLTDKYIIDDMIALLESADMLIGWNSKGHDLPFLVTRALIHGRRLDPKIPHLDLMKSAKGKLQLSSYRLGSVAKLMGTAPKTEISHSLWPKCWLGRYDALKEIADYCLDDVIALEELYEKLLSFIDLPVHFGVLEAKNKHGSCPSCGEEKLTGHGTRATKAGIKIRLLCTSCGSTSTVSPPKS